MLVAIMVGTIGLTACDCLRQVSAVVVEEGTNIPIEGVEIREHHGNGTYDEHAVTSNTNGTFEFSDISGGLRKCPDVQLHFAKPGFVPVDLTFPATMRGDTIRLKAAQ